MLKADYKNKWHHFSVLQMAITSSKLEMNVLVWCIEVLVWCIESAQE